MVSRLAPVLLVLFVLTPAGARAVDGVIEVNHTKALAGGVTATDLAGYPVTLDTGGSYVLTGDLTPPAGTSGIDIPAGVVGVGIDLNSFSIVGAGGGAGDGISGAGAAITAVTNGTIRGFAGLGVAAGSFTRIERVVIAQNTAGGVSCSGRSLLIKNTISLNGSAGVGDGVVCLASKFENNLVTDNAGVGIVSSGSLFIANDVSANGGGGIDIGGSSNVQSNRIGGSGSFGIRGSTSNVIEHNVIDGTSSGGAGPGMGIEITFGSSKINDNQVSSNADAGIWCGDHCTINNNSVSFSGGGGVGFPSAHGIRCAQGCILDNNTSSNNSGDGVHLTGVSAVNAGTYSFNVGDGIECAPTVPIPCAVNNSQIVFNSGAGLLYSFPGVTAGGFRGNVFGGNAGDVAPLGLDLGFMNVCTGGVTPCP